MAGASASPVAHCLIFYRMDLPHRCIDVHLLRTFVFVDNFDLVDHPPVVLPHGHFHRLAWHFFCAVLRAWTIEIRVFSLSSLSDSNSAQAGTLDKVKPMRAMLTTDFMGSPFPIGVNDGCNPCRSDVHPLLEGNVLMSAYPVSSLRSEGSHFGKDSTCTEIVSDYGMVFAAHTDRIA